MSTTVADLRFYHNCYRRKKRGVESKDSGIVVAYGRDTLNHNGVLLLLSVANNHGLAFMNTLFSTPKGGVSRRGKKRNGYILMRQRDPKLVRNVTVHPRLSFLPISNNNILFRIRQNHRTFCSKLPVEGLSGL